MSDLGWVVLERTPAVDAMQALDPAEVSNFAAKRQFPLRVAKRVIAEERERPIFVFAHSLLTHQPYVYQGSRCRDRSDHGTEVGSALAAVRKGTLGARRRLSNFVALRLPRACRDDVPRDLAAVNIFRVVLNCLTTPRMPLLPYRASLLK